MVESEPMAVYVDPPFCMESKNAQAFRAGARHGHEWCHLFADHEEELHALAKRIGMRREWCDEDRGRGEGPHYDLVPPKRAAAIRLGAIEVDRERAIQIWRRQRLLNVAIAEGMTEHEIKIWFAIEWAMGWIR